MITKTVTDSTFHAEVLDSDQPVVVDIWATWCGPCKQVAPILDELSEEVRSARASAVRRRSPRRRRGALAQERRELRARHEEKALDHLYRAGLNRLF